MISFTVEQLEIVTDVIAIFSFSTTLLLLLIMTIKYNRISPKQVATENIAGFNEELVRMINRSEKRNENNPISDEQNADIYKEVERLANLGLSAGDISEKVSIPKSEIDLIVRLKKIGFKGPVENVKEGIGKNCLCQE